MKKSCVHIYTGNGKGKTTCALGLAFRASGHGMHTFIGQFMKAQDCGELQAIAANPCMTVERFGKGCCFRKENVTQEHIDLAQKGFERCREMLHSGKFSIVILDEINVAVWYDLVTVEQVIELIDHRPDDVELILTGRRAHQTLIDKADLVSEINEIKHYYSQGINARKGIEF